MSNDLIKQSYNKVADNYASGRNQSENSKYLDKFNLLLQPISYILDIGCGAGKPVDEFFVSKGHKVVGIDISERMIELAKKNVPEGEFKVEDMTELKDGEYQVDAVVSFYAIFHTPRETHQQLLQKINSFLRKGGLIMITMGKSDWEGKEQNFYGGEMFWSHFDARKNSELVEHAGFQVIVDEIDGTGNEQHQILIARKNS